MESVSHSATPLWHPQPEQIRNSNLARFRTWLREHRALEFDDCHDLFQWSVGDLESDPADGQCTIYGRSDSTLNRGRVRMGTSEFYRIVDSLPEVLGSLVIDTTGLGPDGKETPGKLLLFVTLRTSEPFDEALVNRIRERIKNELSPRYLPDDIFAVPDIPQTLNGKKLEVPVKRIFQGYELSKSVSREAMSNPDSLEPFLDLADRVRTTF
jgi:acetoacetyl-CoA synthetase